MVDPDHFKRTHGIYGHAWGDELLVKISRLLSDRLRTEDSVSRWGGEEFLVLLPQTRQEQTLVVAEKLRASVGKFDVKEEGVDQPITARFGVQCICGAEDLSDLIVKADRMLYQAKRRGRNRVVAA